MGSDGNISIGIETFNKIKNRYLLAFSLVLISVSVSQVFVQKHLSSQLNDSRIINIAGRQRMISQRLSKNILLLQKHENIDKLLSAINTDNKILVEYNNGLRNEYSNIGDLTFDNNSVHSLFDSINTYQVNISNACNKISALNFEDSLSIEDKLDEQVRIVLLNEVPFLKIMDIIVLDFEKESRYRIEQLKNKEYVLFSIIVLVLFFTIALIFRPLSIYIKDIITDLVKTKEDSIDKVNKIEELYTFKEESLLELKELYYAIDNAVLFANISKDGVLQNISKQFGKILGYTKDDEVYFFDNLFVLEESKRQAIDERLQGTNQDIWVDIVELTTSEGNTAWLEMTIIPTRKLKGDSSVFVLCTDITSMIETQKEIDLLNEERFIKKVASQKLQASLIVESQEEERKRIAKDIHDGIGQMLTALNFNIESISPENIESTEVKVGRLKLLLSTLIKEVRAVTFNLTPPELKDYGVFPALSKLSSQLSTYTGKAILYENKSDINLRFDTLVETNLYRVVQEAVNNSLKYANSNYILITVSHTDKMLSIVVDDDGDGFSENDNYKTKKGGGMGMFFMRERISYIGGRLFVNSEKGNGTRVTINLSLS